MVTISRIFLIVIFMSSSVFGKSLNGFKFVIVQKLIYQNGNIDTYGISGRLRANFAAKGFTVLSENSNSWPNLAKQNTCLILTCSPFNSGASTAGFKLVDCNGNTLMEERSTSANWNNDYQDNYNRALKNCWAKIEKTLYQFDNLKTPLLNVATVPITDETEQSLSDYFKSAELLPIEGIYKSYQSDMMLHYKFAIKKFNNIYKAIILESDLVHWKLGEVKAVFEPSSIDEVFSVKWYMGDKEAIETFASIDDGILEVEFTNPVTGNKQKDKFVKMFPLQSNNVKIKTSTSKSSGSGFFVNVDGVIATNAHVVEGASNIEVSLYNDNSVDTYKAKILLLDAKNDVALLKIEDDKFKQLPNIPYSISEISEVGTKVFTIGFPLNDVMGTNYKVTDGIINSNTGIRDDIRYYQISVPLQPGNSGGPLFNNEGNVIGLTSSKLNGQAVGTEVQNVNYAIKSPYLLNLYNMLPHASKLKATSQLNNKEFKEQIKIIKSYVCLIRTF